MEPAGPSRRAAPASALLPREHGAYAQLALPLLAVLVAGRPTVASLAFAGAACAGFLAHEPLLVLLGHRGGRARREQGARARRWLASTVMAAALLGALALGASPPHTRLWVILPVACVAMAGVFVVRRQERSLEGELVACAALVSAAVPSAVGGGMAPPVALATALLFWASFAASTVEIRRITRREASPGARRLVWTIVGLVFSCLAAVRPVLAASMLPLVLTVLGVAVARPDASRLRRLGWMLASASLLTAVATVLAVKVPR